jgi:hypothetical protein
VNGIGCRHQRRMQCGRNFGNDLDSNKNSEYEDCYGCDRVYDAPPFSNASLVGA